jgi:molybdopterin molybdotransferase
LAGIPDMSSLSFTPGLPIAMLPFDTAKQQLLAAARPLTETESLDTELAFGRALAFDVVSPQTVPPFDNAAMDGYALHVAQVPVAGTRLPVSQRIAAGDVAQPLVPGTAARIFTGAELPKGADAVVMQEDCVVDGDSVVVKRLPAAGEHVRLAGSSLRAGDAVLTKGARLSAAALGLAASVGIAELPVFRRLRVAIFFTGSELVMPGEPLKPGHIYNSNRYLMRGFLQDLGVDIVDLGIIPDDRDATEAALVRAGAAADVIVTSGGMSEGEEDYVAGAVGARGRVDVWKIASKPGKPLAFGAVRSGGREVAFIGLPGNPVAVWVGMMVLVVPYLRRCQGFARIEPDRQRLPADFSYKVKGNRLEFIRVRRNERGRLDLYPQQDSAIIGSAVWADGLAAIPAGTTVAPGDSVDYVPGPGWHP